MYYFAKTSIGYSHLKDDKVCQDFSSSYADNSKIIITTCDGHGGKRYIRSELGSMFASNAIMHVFNNINTFYLSESRNKEYLDKLKLDVLCEWNNLVSKHLAKNPIRKSELENLSEKDVIKLKKNKFSAYGTTLIGCMLIKNKLVIIKIGDGDALLFKKGELLEIFADDEENVANLTYSMCEDDAYDHINIRVIDFKGYDGILICTDGLINPYLNYENFKENMLKPLVKEVIYSKNTEGVNKYVDDLGSRLGFGDDVSLGFIMKEKIHIKYYK